MMRDVARVFEAITAGLADDASLLLILDFDGTLTPVAPDPRDAWVSREVRRDIRALGCAERVHVAVLSSRGVDDVRMRVGVAEVIYGGCHGFEIEGPGLAFQHPAATVTRPEIREITRLLRQRLGRIPGAIVEPKGLAVAVHYRDVPSSRVERLEEELQRAVPQQSGLRLIGGRKMMEVVPTFAWGKGQCALWLREHLLSIGRRRVTTVYVGDDVTDEIAFEILREEALTVRVGPGPSAARYRFGDVGEVERLLSALAAELGGHHECD